MKALITSSMAALLVQPIVFLLWFVIPGVIAGGQLPLGEMGEISLFIVALAAIHLLCFGLPAFYLLKAMKRLGWTSIGMAGFVIGSFAIAWFGWPVDLGHGSSFGGNWHGTYREFVVDGKTTWFGWMRYAESVIVFGMQGLAGAWSFLATWRALQPGLPRRERHW